MPRKKRDTPLTLQPDAVVAPGELIRENMAIRGMSEEEFGKRMALDPVAVTALLEGRMLLSLDIAQRLAVTLRYNVRFWQNLEQNYRDGLARGLKKL